MSMSFCFKASTCHSRCTPCCLLHTINLSRQSPIPVHHWQYFRQTSQSRNSLQFVVIIFCACLHFCGVWFDPLTTLTQSSTFISDTTPNSSAAIHTSHDPTMYSCHSLGDQFKDEIESRPNHHNWTYVWLLRRPCMAHSIPDTAATMRRLTRYFFSMLNTISSFPSAISQQFPTVFHTCPIKKHPFENRMKIFLFGNQLKGWLVQHRMHSDWQCERSCVMISAWFDFHFIMMNQSCFSKRGLWTKHNQENRR